MLKASPTLSSIALAMSVLAYVLTQWNIPRVGFEGVIWLGAIFFWCSGLCVLLTCGLCLTSFIKRQRAHLIWPLSSSVLAVAVLALAFGRH